MVSILTVIQHFIESYYSKGWTNQPQVTG
jgi:hypothetical protein